MVISPCSSARYSTQTAASMETAQFTRHCLQIEAANTREACVQLHSSCKPEMGRLTGGKDPSAPGGQGSYGISYRRYFGTVARTVFLIAIPLDACIALVIDNVDECCADSS
jgi:hypothetical protein